MKLTDIRLARWAPALVILLMGLPGISLARAKDERPPEAIFGTYTAPQNVCYMGQPKASNPSGEDVEWVGCHQELDTLSISKSSDGTAVAVTLHFANGHTCEFEGRGTWRRDRLVAYDTDDQDSECVVSIFFFSGAAHIAAPAQQCASYCGSRGSLDGAILDKR